MRSVALLLDPPCLSPRCPPRSVPLVVFEMSSLQVSILDYGAGNVLSVVNSIKAAGYPNVTFISDPSDIASARVIVFPGVGSFGEAMATLNGKGFAEPLKEYIRGGGAFFGICLGMQTLFEGR